MVKSPNGMIIKQNNAVGSMDIKKSQNQKREALQLPSSDFNLNAN